jgi:acetyl esterase/lipase
MTRSAAEAAARRVTAGGIERRDPRLSPLFGEVSGLAPVLLQVGGDECLLDDSTAMAARVEAAGGPVRLEVYPGMQHVFQVMAGTVPEADRAIAAIAAFLQRQLAGQIGARS